MALVLHALLAACMVIGLGIVLAGTFAFVKGGQHHQTTPTSVKIFGLVEMTTGGSLGLIALGIVLIILGPELWEKVPSDVSGGVSEKSVAPSSGSAGAPSRSAPVTPANEPQSTSTRQGINPQDAQTQLAVWESVKSSKDGLVQAYNLIDASLVNWEPKVESNGGPKIISDGMKSAVEQLSNWFERLTSIKNEYPQYQDIPAAISNSNVEELMRAATEFADAVADTRQERNEQLLVKLRPLEGNLRIAMQGMVVWMTALGRTAEMRINDLSAPK